MSKEEVYGNQKTGHVKCQQAYFPPEWCSLLGKRKKFVQVRSNLLISSEKLAWKVDPTNFLIRLPCNYVSFLLSTIYNYFFDKVIFEGQNLEPNKLNNFTWKDNKKNDHNHIPVCSKKNKFASPHQKTLKKCMRNWILLCIWLHFQDYVQRR